MALIPKFLNAGHRAGQAGTLAARSAVYGTRRTPITNAGHARSQLAAAGLGPHSVWQGPRRRPGGAPIVKRL